MNYHIKKKILKKFEEKFGNIEPCKNLKLEDRAHFINSEDSPKYFFRPDLLNIIFLF